MWIIFFTVVAVIAVFFWLWWPWINVTLVRHLPLDKLSDDNVVLHDVDGHVMSPRLANRELQALVADVVRADATVLEIGGSMSDVAITVSECLSDSHRHVVAEKDAVVLKALDANRKAAGAAFAIAPGEVRRSPVAITAKAHAMTDQSGRKVTEELEKEQTFTVQVLQGQYGLSFDTLIISIEHDDGRGAAAAMEFFGESEYQDLLGKHAFTTIIWSDVPGSEEGRKEKVATFKKDVLAKKGFTEVLRHGHWCAWRFDAEAVAAEGL